MTFEDITLLTGVLVALYAFPTLYLAVLRVNEFTEQAEASEPQPRWVSAPCARIIVRLTLSFAFFIFYLVFVIPLIIYGLCRPHYLPAWDGVAPASSRKRIRLKSACCVFRGRDGVGCESGVDEEEAREKEKRSLRSPVWKARGKAGVKTHAAALLTSDQAETLQREAARSGYVDVGVLGMDASALDAAAAAEGASTADA
ncbi:hypothetical protein F5Y14DRAFT_416888 [Nemania sp. NC0429]|nr:hypothetical protein F5Y14DRAFT_416888 [Nemania sp. NC0429]